MSVSAIIVTRGDVALDKVMESLPDEWEKLIWCNRSGLYRWREDVHGDGTTRPTWKAFVSCPDDLSVYGRYHAIQYATYDLIYVQDDDCVVSDPDAIVRSYYEDMLVCNMPQEFRHDFYTDHALVGFGAAFHRAAPDRAFTTFFGADTWPELKLSPFVAVSGPGNGVIGEHFRATCDIVFTGLTPRVLVDVPRENLPHAYGDDRMWKQSNHQGERAHMLDLVMKTKEAVS